MEGFIDGFDWINCEAMKYWSFPKSYKKDPKEETKQLIFSNTYIGSLKKDGYYQRFIKDDNGNTFMIARNKNVHNEAVNKIDWMPQFKDFFEMIPNGTCLLGEVYLPNNEGSKNITKLLGCLKDKCIKRQENEGYLYFYIFDIMAYNGKNLIDTPISDRIKFLDKIDFNYKCVERAEYYEGKQLYNKIGEYLSEGKEGVVITRKDCKVYFKRTPARMTIKIKKELSDSIDCIIIGANPPTIEYTGEKIEDWKYWENTITNEKKEAKLYSEYFNGATIRPITKSYFNGWAGSLKIGMYKNNQIIQIGNLSGLTEKILSNWEKYIGKVVEITAMEIMNSDYKGLRHPKFIQIREDKNPKECIWEEVFKN